MFDSVCAPSVCFLLIPYKPSTRCAKTPDRYFGSTCCILHFVSSCAAPDNWWRYDPTSRQTQHPMMCWCSVCLQSWTLSSDDCSRMIQFHPLGPSGHCVPTQFDGPSPTCSGADSSSWDIPMTTGNFRDHEIYRRHRPPMSAAVPHVGCRDIRHVTSPLPVSLRPVTAHAWLSERCPRLSNRPADMRAYGGVALPVPVPCNHGNQYGDFFRQQVEYRDAVIENLYSMEFPSTMPVCTLLHYTFICCESQL